MKKIIAILLCAALLLSTAACGDKPASAPQPTPSPEVTAQPTPEPTPDPLAVAIEDYGKAIEKLLATENLSLELEVNTTRSLDGRIFSESCTDKITWLGAGSDEPQIHTVRKLNAFGCDGRYEYMYSQGKVYIDGSYAVDMTAGDYIESLYPLQLVDAQLYEQAELREGKLVLSQPTAPESWLGIAPEELLQAEAQVLLGSDGSLQELVYSASYAAKGILTEIELSCSYAEAAADTDLSAEIPAQEDVLPLSDIRLVELLDRVYFAAGSGSSETSSLTMVYQVDAGAVYMVDSIYLDIYGSEDEMLVLLEEDISLTESGQQYEWHNTGSYADGIYTVDSDGEVTRTKLNPSQLSPGSSLVSYIVTPDFIQSASISQPDGYLLIEFECYPEMGEYMQESICMDLYGDGDMLSELADGYATDSFKGHLAFDLASMLPTGYSLEYAGHHSIQGADYNISLKNYLSLNLCSTAAYKNITGETLAEPEPETRATPLFYKVSGENGQVMWLLGTIHVGDERTSYLPESIYSALEGSDALALEIDIEGLEDRLDADEALMAQYSAAVLSTDLSTVDSHLSPELYQQALAMMKATGNYTANIEYFRPYTWLSSMENSLLEHSSSLSYDKGVDMRLTEFARARDIPVWDIEPLIERTELVYGMSDGLVEYMLADMFSYDRYQSAAETQELFELWCTGDEEALRSMILGEDEDVSEDEQALFDEYADIMYVQRNAWMLDKAIEYLESGETVFYAVGLAHLLGMDNLVDALREAGYTVEIVK